MSRLVDVREPRNGRCYINSAENHSLLETDGDQYIRPSYIL